MNAARASPNRTATVPASRGTPMTSGTKTVAARRILIDQEDAALGCSAVRR